MCTGVAGLRLPGDSAIRCCDDGAKSTDCPTMQRIVRSKCHGKQMIARAGSALRPLLATILCCQDYTPCASNYEMISIFDVDAIERSVRRRTLFIPIKSSVAGYEDDAITTDSPAVAFVSGKFDRVDGIPLG